MRGEKTINRGSCAVGNDIARIVEAAGLPPKNRAWLGGTGGQARKEKRAETESVLNQMLA